MSQAAAEITSNAYHATNNGGHVECPCARASPHVTDSRSNVVHSKDLQICSSFLVLPHFFIAQRL
jgi:hypothetical protein